MRSSRLPAIALAALAAAVCVAGCTADDEPEPPTAPAPRVALEDLDASVTQFRFDEGTRRLKAGVTNNGDQDIHVSQASLDWDGFAFPSVPVPGGATRPGQTAAFTIAYGAARCDRPPEGRPTLRAVIDGQPQQLPLRVEDPELLDRLHAKACAEQRLTAAVSVRLRLASRSVMVLGEEYVPGRLVLTHRPGASDRVRVVDLGGSVLLNLVPRDGRRTLPAELRPGARSESLPVLIGSAHRCDAHALSQSSQTFLISAYVRLGDGPTQREILDVASADRDRLFGVISRDCR